MKPDIKIVLFLTLAAILIAQPVLGFQKIEITNDMISASGQFSTNYANHSIDNDNATQWISEENPDNYLKIDFSEERNVTAVQVVNLANPGVNGILSFSFQYSDDDSAWTTIHNKSDGTIVTNYSFYLSTQKKHRYWRFQGVHRDISTDYGEFAEIYFWNGTNATNETGYFKIRAIDRYNSSQIFIFNATVNGTFYETTNGTIYTSILKNTTKLVNITIQAQGYFTKECTNQNVSKDITTKLHQAVAYFSVTEVVTNDTIENFTLTTIYNQTKEGVLYLTEGTHKVTFSKEGYQNKTINVTVSALSNTTWNITGVGNYKVNITVNDQIGEQVLNFTLNTTGITHGFYASQNTTKGYIEIDLINGTYNFTVDSPGYEIITNTSKINESKKINLNIQGLNNVSVSFYDELTNNLMEGKEVEIELVSDLFAGNYTTMSGKYNWSLLTPAEYRITYSAEGYSERTQYFTLLDRTDKSLKLYLINESEQTTVTITVYDENNDGIENVTIKVQRYDVTTNGYITQEIIRTNFEGKAETHIILHTEYYKFILEYEGETKLTTQPAVIFEESLVLQISLTEPTATKFFNLLDIAYTLSFNNETNRFKYTYNDENNVINKGCLLLWKERVQGRELVNQTCKEGIANTIYGEIKRIDGATYTAEARVEYGSEEYTLQELTWTYPQEVSLGGLGLFLVGILTIVVVLTMFWKPSLAVMITPLPLILASVGGLISVSVYLLIPIQLMAIIIALVISNKG